MAVCLKIDYASVQGLVDDMKTYETQVEELYSDMTTIVQSLVTNGYMEADSANAYVSEFTEMLGPDIENLSELLTTFHTQLSEICENFKDADAQIAKMLFK